MIEQLNKKREEIDATDEELIHLISKRFQIVQEIALIKKELKLPMFDKRRFEKMLEERMENAKNKNIDPEFIMELFKLIHSEALKIENI
jgi:chorismate mutase